jgi:predicted permease
VEAAALASSTPYGANAISLSFNVPGHARHSDKQEVADFNFVSPQYFTTMSQPMLRGRDFRDSDDGQHASVAIVNASFARKYWQGLDPIGRKFRQGGRDFGGGGRDIEVVGVVKDARDRDLRKGASPAVYLPVKQAQTSGLTLLARINGAPATTIPSLLAVVATVDKHIPVSSVHTLDLQIEAGISSERILGHLSALFAALATLLAGIGLYGVIAYSVARRTREIGIRVATGALQRDIGILFARESLFLVVMGIVVGIPAAIASARVLQSLLYGVTTSDTVTLVISIAALVLASAAAIITPLWRAIRMSPMAALRYE